MNARELNIGIVGGGIGGLAAAVALGSVGAEATVMSAPRNCAKRARA